MSSGEPHEELLSPGYRASVLLSVVFSLVTGCDDSSQKISPPLVEVSTPQIDVEQLRPQIVEFCSDCHVYPKPDTFPRSDWRYEVKQAFGFFEDSGKTDLDPPSLETVIAYYEAQAPESLTLPTPNENPGSGPVEFRREFIARPDGIASSAVSYLRWIPAAETGQQSGSLLACDMGAGEISRLVFRKDEVSIENLASVLHPAHVEPCDFDKDGHLDFLISELGSFMPADHDRGEVVLMRFDRETDAYIRHVLKRNLGRVADARAADFDSDGDLDVIVAVFGWRKTGQILLLEQVDTPRNNFAFKTHVLDPRHGASHVPIVDFDGDGDLDFVALITQEHETIVAFLNSGDGSFRQETLYSAKDPGYGLTGMQVVDLDGDADLDILFANGDSFDSNVLKPYHAVQWIENQGDFSFQHHNIAFLPGAFTPVAGDLDQDGDLDLAVCSMTWKYDLSFNTVIWFEQTQPGEFSRHDLDFSSEQHPSLELGDFDLDGDLDIAVGQFDDPPIVHPEWVSIWWNEGASGN